jgi:hypothetical protein
MLLTHRRRGEDYSGVDKIGIPVYIYLLWVVTATELTVVSAVQTSAVFGWYVGSVCSRSS